jgi:hypothetical protein
MLIFLKDMLLQKLEIAILDQFKPLFPGDIFMELKTRIDDMQKRKRIVFEHSFQLPTGIFLIRA